MYLLKYKLDGLILDNVRYFCDRLLKIFAYWDVLRFFPLKKIYDLRVFSFLVVLYYEDSASFDIL